MKWMARWRAEFVCAAAVAAVSLLSAFIWLPRFHDYFFVWDHDFSPAVAVACGHDLAEVNDPVPTLSDFLHRRRADFDCSGMPPNVALGPVNAYAEGIPYFLKALGLYWRQTGVSWAALAPLFGILFAVSNTILFFLLREFLGNALGVVVALVYGMSPSNYRALTYYEHYAKTPIFLAVVLIMVWVVRHRTPPRRLFVAAAGGGVLLGLGFGVRADLWLLGVLFAATLLAFVGPELRARSRLVACAIFLAVGCAVALPAARVGGVSYFWLQVLQGLSTPFDRDLAVRPGVYEWIPQYNDNLGLSWMQTHAFYQVERHTSADVDAFTGSSAPPPGVIAWQAREAAGRSGYLAIMRNFPADFITRPLASVLAVIRLSLGSQPGYINDFGAGPNFFTRTSRLWSWLRSASAAPAVILALAIIALLARRRREAAFALSAILFLGGMTAIVFLPRHQWHLYFIGFLAAGLAVRSVVVAVPAPLSTIRAAGATLARALPIALVLAGAAFVTVAASRVYQDRNVDALIRRLLAGERDAVRVEPTASAAVVEASELMRQFEHQSKTSDHFQYTHYLMATFSRSGCGAVTTVKALYRASQPFYDDTRTVALDFSHESSTFRFVFPAYNVRIGANFGYFRGFDLGSAPAGCLARLDRFRSPAAFPFLITWHLPERWDLAARHQTIALTGE
jgi:hypothetical protein